MRSFKILLIAMIFIHALATATAFAEDNARLRYDIMKTILNWKNTAHKSQIKKKVI